MLWDPLSILSRPFVVSSYFILVMLISYKMVFRSEWYCIAQYLYFSVIWIAFVVAAQVLECPVNNSKYVRHTSVKEIFIVRAHSV